MKLLLGTVVLISIVFTCDALPQSIDNIGDSGRTQESYNTEYEEPNANDVMLRIKRECIARHSSCDRNPSGCCSDDTCRCNLWGANCKCGPKGLFG